MIESGFRSTFDPVSHQLYSQFLPSRQTDPRTYPASGKARTGGRESHRSALVVDDVSDVTEMLSVLLTHAGYDVTAASSAAQAIAIAKTKQFDVVISDIGMPEMNGYELATALRNLPDYKDVPMVAVTGYSMFDDRSRSLTAGFTEHVTKPIDPRSFLDLIEQLK